MAEPRDVDPIAKIVRRFIPEVRAAKSLFLPLVPRRKFPPSRSLRLPPEVLVPLTTDIALQTIFPFLFDELSETLPSEAAFHDYVATMATDKEAVINRAVNITLDTGVEALLKIEFCFSSRLVDRIRLIGEAGRPGQPYFFHFLVDLVSQAAEHADSLIDTVDEIGNHWLRLRGASPYRPDAFFTDVTILAHDAYSLIRIVFAERDDDFDSWYRYEWMSPFVKDALLFRELSIPVDGNEQASVLGLFLKKLTKLLAEKPR